MNIKKLCYAHDSPSCEGNLLPDALYLTEEGKLIVLGHCALCGDHIQVAMTIEELICKMPESSGKPIKPTLINPKEIQVDAEWLHSIGIDPNPARGK